MCANDIKFKDVCRNILFICNCVLFLSGCALLGIGIYLMFNLISFGDYLEEFDPQSALDAYDQNSAVILLGLGGVIMGISFLGCCGAMIGNHFSIFCRVRIDFLLDIEDPSFHVFKIFQKMFACFTLMAR